MQAAAREPVWVVVPAAGHGSRMALDVPKQYLEVAGRKVIEHTLEAFTRHERVAGVVVALAEADPWWPEVRVAGAEKLSTVCGGTERAHSVVNGLTAVAQYAPEDSWAIVHDAARPCLRRTDFDRLLAEAGNDAVGGLLAAPVRDTMKRAGSDRRVTATVDRADLWHALTPQMFHLGPLLQALQAALADNVIVTDEAQAMERAGHRPLIVEGRADNIKITRMQDLALAEQFLHAVAVAEPCA